MPNSAARSPRAALDLRVADGDDLGALLPRPGDEVVIADHAGAHEADLQARAFAQTPRACRGGLHAGRSPKPEQTDRVWTTNIRRRVGRIRQPAPDRHPGRSSIADLVVNSEERPIRAPRRSVLDPERGQTRLSANARSSFPIVAWRRRERKGGRALPPRFPRHAPVRAPPGSGRREPVPMSRTPK